MTINPLAAALSSVAVSPSTILNRQTGTGTVTITAAAPSGGAVVSLASSNANAASVPASVTVPQGKTSATFTLTAGRVRYATPVTITASYSGISKSASVTIKR